MIKRYAGILTVVLVVLVVAIIVVWADSNGYIADALGVNRR